MTASEPALVGADPWTEHMRRGEFEAAWRISDEALRERIGVPCYDWPRHLQYVWQGESLAKKRVLVRCYHGLGDTVQFIRYVRLLKAVAREVIVWVQPALMPLLAGMGGIDRLVALNDGDPGVDYDVDVELMELPHIFRTRLDTIPADVPYIEVPPSKDGWAERFTDAGRSNVGFVWRSGDWDDRRSVPAELLQPLIEIEGVNWILLQHGATPPRAWAQRCRIVGDHTLAEAAQIMRALDLVVTVDTLAAHLAGALAVPTWTLLHAEADWRWMLEREDSPWYPTMRLFRQERAGDWTSVIARLQEAVTGLRDAR